MDKFTIAYRTGGTHDCTWRRVLEVYETREDAAAAAAKIEKMGYRTIIRTLAQLKSCGLPLGWTSDSVDWDRDRYTVSEYETHHIKAA